MDARLTSARRPTSPRRPTSARRPTSPRRPTSARRPTSPRRLTSPRRPTSARRPSSAGRYNSPLVPIKSIFIKEYTEILDLNSGTLKLLKEKQQGLDALIKLLETKTLIEIRGNDAEMTSMKWEVDHTRKLVMAIGLYISNDLKTALMRLTETAGKYCTLMQRKMNEEFDEEGTEIEVETFVLTMMEMQELQVFARQLGSSIGEMMSEITLAAAYMFSSENDFRIANRDRIEAKRKATEAERQRIEKIEKEVMIRRWEEEYREKQRKEETRRLFEEKQKRQIEAKRQRMEEDEKRRIEEERKAARLIEKESKRQKMEKELERLRMERQRMENDIEKLSRMLEQERKNREEEDEKRRQAREEIKRRKDPHNWTNVLVYGVEGSKDALGHGIACIIRVPDDVTLDKSQLTCTVLETSVNRHLLEENEELVSNLVNIRPSGRSGGLLFQRSLWMAFPCSYADRTRETVIKVQHLQSASSPAKWTYAPTRDTDITNEMVVEKMRLVETKLRHLSSEGINVVVVVKRKVDRQTFNNDGGVMTSTIDVRIQVTVPKNAFKSPTSITIQVMPADSTVLKERYDDCENLLGASPFVDITCQVEPQIPLTFTVPNPSRSCGRSRPKTPINDREDILRPSTSMPPNSGENDEKDVISLLTRGANGQWRSRQDVSLDVQKDSTAFQMSTLAQRLLLLRTSGIPQDSELSKIAKTLEETLEDRLASVLVRQNPLDLNNIYVECCNREVASKRIQSLSDYHMTQGPPPNQVLLKEGDLVEVSFAGNIHFEDRTPRLFTYHSNLTSSNFFEIKEVDQSAQEDLDNYSGTMRLRLVERPYKPPNKFLASTDANIQKTATAARDTGFICEFPITLPKQEEANRSKKVHLSLAERGPLTDEYLDHLSKELGEDWTMLATRLKFNSASVERISSKNAHLMSADATQRSARQMLREWFRISMKATDKVRIGRRLNESNQQIVVEELQLALESVGKTKLAEELGTMNRHYKEQTERKQNRAHLMKCIKAYSESQAAVNEWRTVGLALGLGVEDVDAISQAEGIREQARAMLMKWIEVLGDKATKDSLIRCLKKLNLNEAVGKVELVV